MQDYGEILRWHYTMLLDRERTDSYRRAIAEVVKPGDVVLDIGTGTGVLSCFAAQAGARRVYAIERGPAIELARVLRAANGLEDRIDLIHGTSQEAKLPERANVLITETLWNFGLGEGMLGAVIDAHERHLVPEARIVPQSVELIVALIDTPPQSLTLWSSDLYGLDFTPIRGLAANNHYPVSIDESALISRPQTIATVELGTVADADVIATATVPVTRAGTVYGVVGWFRAQLSPEVSLTNAPPLRTPNWKQTLLPLESPIVVEAETEVALSVGTAANGSHWTWRVGAPGADSPQQSTLWGFPVSPGVMTGGTGP